MTRFEQELSELLNRMNKIADKISSHELPSSKISSLIDIWFNDVEIFHDKYLKKHKLSHRIIMSLISREDNDVTTVYNCLISISKDSDFINQMRIQESNSEFYNQMIIQESNVVPTYQPKRLQRDVFISHASKDKLDFVDELYRSLYKMRINIWYDTKVLEWGDYWKDEIIKGINMSEFAIIVISENFFGREWTERELYELLHRQNQTGQKIILPILHNITNNDLRKKYPSLADIQTINSKDYTYDEIALLFAGILIKRLKALT